MKSKTPKSVFIFLTISILISAGLGLFSSNLVQLEVPLQKGYYTFLKKNEVIGNVKSLDEVKSFLYKKYGNKANLDIYFGDDVLVEYIKNDDKVVEFSPIESILANVDVQVDALKVSTLGEKAFYITSYNDWKRSISDVIDFVSANDSENIALSSMARGDVKVAETFQYEYQKVPIELVLDDTEAKEKLIFNDESSIKMDIVQSGDTVETLAKRNNISVTQLLYANGIEQTDLLLPGAKLKVSELNYAVSFSYPVLEDIVEDIAFEIEYIDSPELFVGAEQIIQQGVNGLARAKYISNVVNGESIPGQRLEYQVIRETVKQIVHKGTKIQQKQTTEKAGDGQVKTAAPYANEAGFIWPAIGICVSAEYGWYEYGAHKGLDIAGRSGEAIWAAAAGTVESAEYSGAFGNQVLINHNNGLKTRYAHLKTIGVNKGQQVKQGEVVGGMGSTGMSEADHLHFEVHAGGERLNPRGYLPAGGPRTC
ncbi:MAG: peptidoglycan DD-metalloendopeptidase family protein [Culicoidibacterales bacterium]